MVIQSARAAPAIQLPHHCNLSVIKDKKKKKIRIKSVEMGSYPDIQGVQSNIK